MIGIFLYAAITDFNKAKLPFHNMKHMLNLGSHTRFGFVFLCSLAESDLFIMPFLLVKSFARGVADFIFSF